MFDYDLELDLEQELSEIPPEYQDAFRQAIDQELAETEQNRTDTDILTYLRQRRDDFQRGGFIRPDGRTGIMALDPETMYEQALPELTRSSLGEGDRVAERRRLLVKMGILGGVVLLFLVIIFRGRARRAEPDPVPAETAVAVVSADGTPVPTPPLPEITGTDDSLQTIGSLGGALTIGRPSAIELTYGRTEETIALAIDPSKSTPKGVLRYNETTMLSDNPVAVWLFGTVLNYTIGIPDSMVRNLESGDHITLNTDTGASLHFVIAETGQAASYETGRLLSQNRLGLTLFALPATAEDDVSFAMASYDITSEAEQSQPLLALGDRFTLDSDGVMAITAATFDQTLNGSTQITVTGHVAELKPGAGAMLSLTIGSTQAAAVQLEPDESGDWKASFTVPGGMYRLPVLAELRTLPGNHLSVVRLGELPRFLEQLDVTNTKTWWDESSKEVNMDFSVTNSGAGAVYLAPDFIQLLPTEGGDAYEFAGQVVPRLPVLIRPGETLGITVSFLPQSASIRLQIGAGLWEVSGIPVSDPYPTGR